MKEHSPEYETSLNLPEPAGKSQEGFPNAYTSANENEGAKAVESNSSTADPGQFFAQSNSAAHPAPNNSTLSSNSQYAQDHASQIISGMPQIAEDKNNIEKEWVQKAKHIVAMTKQDPYSQNIEMNKVKANYLKKRYNMDINTTGKAD